MKISFSTENGLFDFGFFSKISLQRKKKAIIKVVKGTVVIRACNFLIGRLLEISCTVPSSSKTCLSSEFVCFIIKAFLSFERTEYLPQIILSQYFDISKIVLL